MSGNLQGVETPSQKRYIYQVEQLLLKQKKYWNDDPLSLPQSKKLKLKSLNLDSFFSNPAGMAFLGPLVCTLSVEGVRLFTSEPILHEVLSNKVSFGLGSIEIAGDIQVSVYARDRMKAEKVKKSGKEKVRKACEERSECIKEISETLKYSVVAWLLAWLLASLLAFLIV